MIPTFTELSTCFPGIEETIALVSEQTNLEKTFEGLRKTSQFKTRFRTLARMEAIAAQALIQEAQNASWVHSHKEAFSLFAVYLRNDTNKRELQYTLAALMFIHFGWLLSTTEALGFNTFDPLDIPPTPPQFLSPQTLFLDDLEAYIPTSPKARLITKYAPFSLGEYPLSDHHFDHIGMYRSAILRCKEYVGKQIELAIQEQKEFVTL